VLGTPLLWRSTVAMTYLKVKPPVLLFISSGLGLVTSGFGLGLKNLVLIYITGYGAEYGVFGVICGL